MMKVDAVMARVAEAMLARKDRRWEWRLSDDSSTSLEGMV